MGKTKDVNKKMETEDDIIIKMMQSEEEILSEEDTKVGEQIDDNPSSNSLSLEVKPKKREQKKDKSTSSFETMNDTHPVVYDNHSVIDFDYEEKGKYRKLKGSTVFLEVEEEIEQNQDQVNPIMDSTDSCNKSKITEFGKDSSSDVNATAQNRTRDLQDLNINATNTTITKSKEQKKPPKGSLASFFENARAKSDVGTESVLRQAQFLGEKQQQQHHESPTTVATAGYHGEPWGQYRSTRRLPDLELLRLVFENANNGGTNRGGTNRGKGDTKSHKVLKEWQKDPLFDESMMIEAVKSSKNSVKGVGATIPEEELDPKFHEYRSRFFGGYNNSVANDNPNAKHAGGRKNDRSNIDSNQNVNSEFVEGLDDIDDFFEGVDPPDELDVGFGSSIQDVLMDKGKHILSKKFRGLLQWIRIGYKKMRHNLKERISQFQLPFQKFHETTNMSYGFKLNAMNSTINADTKEQHDERTIQDTIIAAWTIGKRTLEHMSNWMDRLLDRFDSEIDERSDGEPINFEDFNGFDIDNLSTLMLPKHDL